MNTLYPTLTRSFSITRLGSNQVNHLSRQTKFHPVLLCDSETWVLTKREENQVFVFERKVLRTICDPKFEKNVYRSRTNHEPDKEFKSLNVLKVTKTSRLHYAGHMIRIQNINVLMIGSNV
jgi:hypothetical protein